MKTHSGLAMCLLLTGPVFLRAGTAMIDFEGLSGAPVIPGIVFDSVEVVTPATIANSPGVPLSAATSGRSAAFSSGAQIRFSSPVFRVQVTVSPSFITVPLSGEVTWFKARLVAYKKDGSILTRSQAEVIASVQRNEDVKNFTPSTLSVSSTTPISLATLDFDDPFNPSGTTFFFDDLVLTMGEDAQAVRPAVHIENTEHTYLSWSCPNCILQWATNSVNGPWQSIFEATNRLYYFIDTRAPSMYFRVERLLSLDSAHEETGEKPSNLR